MKKLLWVIPALAMLILSGCASTQDENNNIANEDIRAVVAATYEEAVKEAMKIGPEMIDAFLNDDFELFTSRLTPAQKAKVNKESLSQTSKKFNEGLGEVIAVEYLTDLKTSLITTFLWKVSFEKDSETKPGEKIRYDFLYKVAIGMDGDSYIITSFGW